MKEVEIPTKPRLISLEEAIFYNVPNLKKIVFREGRESILGYAMIQSDASMEIIVPASVKNFSPLTFLITPSTNITITFLGDAPEIVDDVDPEWFGNPTIFYAPETTGWDTFVWKDLFELKPLPQN